MRAGLAKRVQSFIEQHRMMHAGDRIGVAVSGGADSVALLLLLEELREPLGLLLTVLAHLLRGTGPAGLGAIYPLAGTTVRPLLEIRRIELREYLKKKKQAWREDSSNLDTRRTRARIREKLVPLLEREFQPAAVEQLARLAGLAREDEAFWKALVEDRYRTLVRPESARPSNRVADLLEPLQLPGEHREAMAALSKRLIRRLVEGVKGDRRQLTAEHVAQVMRLASDGTSGQRTDLAGGSEAARG